MSLGREAPICLDSVRPPVQVGRCRHGRGAGRLCLTRQKRDVPARETRRQVRETKRQVSTGEWVGPPSSLLPNRAGCMMVSPCGVTRVVFVTLITGCHASRLYPLSANSVMFMVNSNSSLAYSGHVQIDIQRHTFAVVSLQWKH